MTAEYVTSGDRPAVSYGPAHPSQPGEWVLAVTTEEAGRVELTLGEQAMYDLWIEVRGVPWPQRADTEEDRLVRQEVHAANGADEEMLWDALEALGVRP